MAHGYLQSRIRLERKVEGDEANLTLRVRRGPRRRDAIRGRDAAAEDPGRGADAVASRRLRQAARRRRRRSAARVADDRRLPAAEGRLHHRRQHAERPPCRRSTVEAGPHYDKVVLAFDGASGIDPDELDKIVEHQDLERQLFTDPLVVTELLERYYRDQGYLSAEIDEPRIEYQGSMARVVLAGARGSQVHRAPRRGRGATRSWSTETILPQLPVLERRAVPARAPQNSRWTRFGRCTGRWATTTCDPTTPLVIDRHRPVRSM